MFIYTHTYIYIHTKLPIYLCTYTYLWTIAYNGDQWQDDQWLKHEFDSRFTTLLPGHGLYFTQASNLKQGGLLLMSFVSENNSTTHCIALILFNFMLKSCIHSYCTYFKITDSEDVHINVLLLICMYWMLFSYKGVVIRSVVNELGYTRNDWIYMCKLGKKRVDASEHDLAMFNFEV